MNLDQALEQFDRTEANVAKLEGFWEIYCAADPGAVGFGLDTPEIDQVRRDWALFVKKLPLIEGFRPVTELPTLDSPEQDGLDALEVGMIEAKNLTEDSVTQPGRDLADYRHRLRSNRRKLTRKALDETLRAVDSILQATHHTDEGLIFDDSESNGWPQLISNWKQIHRLMGSDCPSGERWSDMRRHIHFAEPHDLQDIVDKDWPTVRESILDHAFEGEPIPVEAVELSDLVEEAPSGPVSTSLNWSVLDPDGFERVVLEILRSSKGYENCKRLMHVHASDKGRDLSADRVVVDTLSGTKRIPVMIQCKHYQAKSVGLPECTQAVEQAKLWTDARFQVVVIATSGNLTQQALEWIEKRHTDGDVPAVDVWNQTDLEWFLAPKPAIRASFGL